MTVYFDKGRGAWRYDFRLYGTRYTYPRSFPTKQECADAEATLRSRIRRQRVGLEPIERPESPTFTVAAGAYYRFASDRNLVGDLQTLDRMQRVVLRFFGAKPKLENPRIADKWATAPYHNLRLQDVIDDPSWIAKFEQWMIKLKISGSTKNRYRSAVSRMYWWAMLPQNRQQAGITMNPMRGILRDVEEGWDVTLSVEQLRAILLHALPHLRLAIVIAALAPKLRRGNILALRWDRHIDRDLTRITVAKHKTRRRTKRPLVTPISVQLKVILRAAKASKPKGMPYVIHFRGGRIYRLEQGLQAACKAAGVRYGRKYPDGATFHTIRHSAATMLAQIGVPDGLIKDILGHLSIQTTQGYKHLRPVHEIGPLEQLSGVFDFTEALKP